ncbi:tRNA (uridine(34)/cytosine(34)/5-carboxymethylaminomethyluridine(34)-2'-O)-methyltransferase TrmL [Thiofilum flexile]|uniref:tRNA (uridine(34)/cytosine(34)/5- carboxymethylaminomethyluridine(34)-2'-O)- methyltransferase TrmL n=1 Tax=Thiofilum flexile TaxID=125627 RepID=UPI00036712EC|nr:tRNA (uridine(34)/cytosine(34)/5-carboxymethylaminomethyluridine(34)-2'-O)-methyltransferase TrmL [Thiofilum flexile]
MFEVALYEPEIPPNTGNIMRLCANTGCVLHLIHPLGFQLDEKRLRRAGMDYRDLAVVKEHESFAAFAQHVANKRLFALTTKAQRSYTEVTFEPEDIFLFGPETRGLPEPILAALGEQCIRLPMLPESRSLNLSNTAAIVVYEALRQQQFQGLS